MYMVTKGIFVKLSIWSEYFDENIQSGLISLI